jgi:hypothetical protein
MEAAHQTHLTSCNLLCHLVGLLHHFCDVANLHQQPVTPQTWLSADTLQVCVKKKLHQALLMHYVQMVGLLQQMKG